MARPSDFKPEYTQRVAELCATGLTDEEVAQELGCSVRTLYRWQHGNPEFCQALKLGKVAPNERVKQSLYHSAIGFRYTEQQAIKVKDGDGVERVEVVEVERACPPNPTAQVFFLKNRVPEEFRDKQEITGADGKDLVPALDSQAVAKELAFILAQAAHKKDSDGA